jgi:hypothetical protein
MLLRALVRTMTAFDQRNQNVYGNQFNIAQGGGQADIASMVELIAQLDSISSAVSHAQIGDEAAADIQHEIHQAIASATAGDATRTRDRLERARQVMQSIASTGTVIASLANALTEAIHACARVMGA